MDCCVQDSTNNEIPGSERFGYASEQIMTNGDDFFILSMLGFNSSIFSISGGNLILTIPNWVQCCIISYVAIEINVNYNRLYFTFSSSSPCSTFIYSTSRIINLMDILDIGGINFLNVVCFSNNGFPNPAPGLSNKNHSISQLTTFNSGLGTIMNFKPGVIFDEILSFSNSTPGKLFFARLISGIFTLNLLFDNTYGNCISGTYWIFYNAGIITSNFGYRLTQNLSCNSLPFYNAPDSMMDLKNRFGQPLKIIVFLLPSITSLDDINLAGINFIVQ